MDIRTLVKMVHDTAKEKGWWEGGARNPLELIALMHSELSEAVEECRKGTPPIYQKWISIDSEEELLVTTTPDNPGWNPALKPEGELVELADAVIRIMDYCGHKGYDLENAILMKHAFNTTRAHRHGGKRY